MTVDDFLHNPGSIPVSEILAVPEGTILVIKVPEDSTEQEIIEIQMSLNSILPSSVHYLVTNRDWDISVLEPEEAEDIIDQLRAVIEEDEDEED